jgi:hypothetical protein
MPDLALQFGGDLSLGPTGDLQLSDGSNLTQQRVLLRLLTNAGDYIWQLNYGAGLGSFVGTPGAPAAIAGVARMQMLLESRVATSPSPNISSNLNDGGTVSLSINYADAVTQDTTVLNFSL